MKVFVCILLGFFSFSILDTKNDIATDDLYNLEGVWELEHQFLYNDHQVSDTIFNTNGYRQVKIYSKGKVYGSYKITDNILEERLEYASGPMMKIVDTTKVFKFELVMDKNDYQQIAVDEEGHYSQSENYTKVK